ncbi:3-oxoadipate enol-lactonase/4-carboxymuconolactone decarboxylase [Kushneria sinocarnis]|uniref:3-oxoadipate enol-lactonase/4-carboxymuconolactone decarboxylase n=1 Tax=Kushneria sinocarnis TaxID=595502 RepID=A0A420WWD2_9GAMM|nr:alpha/beta fold hydrolase [Kushneria sinocarnis]RKR03421.1 3-oxoadipate enol-lactonase/4-carboxymuconolactone decarboxylase [Kushneria sinocarnis]
MHFTTINNRLIAWRLIGPPAAPLVVLAHPLGMNQGVWDELLGALVPRYRVLTWDLPGHGSSAPVEQALSAADLADEVRALIAAAGAEHCHFVGTSIGGMIGLQLLHDCPEMIEHMVLTNTGLQIGAPDNWHERAARVRREGLEHMAGELAPRWFSPATRQTVPELVDGWTRQLERVDDESYARLCELLAATDFRQQEWPAPLPALQLIGGREDGATPPETLQTLAHGLHDAPLDIFDDVGHVPSVEAPENMTTLLLRHLFVQRGGEQGVDFETGLAVRQRVLGHEHVERSLSAATPFNLPFQQLITRFAWGELWGDDTFSVTQRSLITLAILAALGRDGELRLHLKTAYRTGVSETELRQVLMHVATYAGVPAANHAFSLAREYGWGDEHQGEHS